MRSSFTINAATTRFMIKASSCLLLATDLARWVMTDAPPRARRPFDNLRTGSRDSRQNAGTATRQPAVKIGPLFLTLLQSFADESGAVFNQFAVFRSECRKKVAVDIEFSHHLPTHKNWDYDLGLGFDRTGEIAVIFRYIVHHHRLSRRSGRAADTLMQRNAGMRSHGSLIMSEDQRGWIGVHFQQVEADPVVFQHVLI